MGLVKENVDRLTYWIKERESVRKRKEAGDPKPWTSDSILQSYRFCNVQRENDKVTKWISKHWRTPHYRDPSLWFAMAVARFINWPDTLEEIGYPVPWRPKSIWAKLDARTVRGEKVWTGAYMVSTNGRRMSKAEYVVENVLSGLWNSREKLTPVRGQTLKEYCSLLMTQHGISGFMAGQIIADLKYAAPLSAASDWATFAVPGPGSLRGLNRVCGRPTEARWRVSEWLAILTDLRAQILPQLARSSLSGLHAQDLQNCLCEFDKYERVWLGEGRTRSTYDGGKQT